MQTASNWDNGFGSNESLFFGNAWVTAGRTGSTTVNNGSAYSGYRLTFESITNPVTFTLQGSAITLFDFGGQVPKIENFSTNNQNVNTNISFGSGDHGEINAVNGNLTFGGTVTATAVNGIRLYGGGETVNFNNTVNATGKYIGISTNGTGNTINVNASLTASDFSVINNGVLNLNSGGSINAAVRLGVDYTGSGNVNNASGASFNLTNASGGQSFSGTINSAGGIVGTLAANTSGALAVNSQNTSNANTLSGHIALDSPLTITQAGGGTLNITQGRSSAGGTTAGTDVKAQTLTFGGAGSIVVGPTTPTGFGTIYDSVSGASGTAILMNGTGSLTFNDANSYRGKTQINSGTLFVGANNALGSSNGTIGTTGNTVLLGNTTGSSNASLLTTGAFTIANAIQTQTGNSGTLTLGGNAAAASIYSGTITLGTASAAAKDATFVALAGGSVDFQGVINEASGATTTANVNIGDGTHSGTVKFSNVSNQYDGVTTINAGTLEVTKLANKGTGSSIGNSNAVANAAASASTLIINGGTLKYTGTGDSTDRLFTIGTAGATIDASASANGVLAFTNTGSLVASGTGNRTLTLTGTSTGANSLAAAIANPSSGTLSVTKSGLGTWQLSGSAANTYTGLTTVSQGELDLNKTPGGTEATSPNAIGSGGVTISGGTLKWLANWQVNDSALITLNSGTVNLNGFQDTVGTFINTGGTFTTGVGGALTGTAASISWSGGTNTINSGGSVTDGHISLSNGTSATFAEVQGGGTMHLLSGGVGLQMTGATLTLDSSAGTAGQLLLDGNVSTIASSTTSFINSSGNAANAGFIDMNGGTRTYTVATGTTSSGIDLSIGAKLTSPGGAVTKLGTGTMELTGANTYGGNTNVNAGTLLANNTSGSATGSGGVMVNSGGTLGGIGAINTNSVMSNNVNINGGGTITGATNGTVGALTLTTTSVIFGGSAGNLSTYLVDLTAGSSDRLAITGNLDLSSAFDQITFQGTTGAASYQLITYSGLLSGSFDTVSSLPTGYALSYSTPGEIDLVAVPETSTWVMGVLALSALLFSQRRRLSPALEKILGK